MAEKKKTNGFTHSMAAKTFAFIMCIIMLCLTAVSIAGVCIAWESGCYVFPEENLRRRAFDDVTENNYSSIILEIEAAPQYDSFGNGNLFKYRNIGSLKVEDVTNGTVIFDEAPKKVNDEFIYTQYYVVAKEEDRNIKILELVDGDYIPDPDSSESLRRLTVGIAAELSVPDEYYWRSLFVDLLYIFKFWIYPIGIGTFILAVVCFVFLMCAAGKRKGKEEVAPSALTRIPFEIPTFSMLFAAILSFYVIDAVDHSDVAVIVALVCVGICWTVMGIIWLMSLAIRIKLGTLLRNTITFRVLRMIWRSFCVVGRVLAAFVRSIPLIWKTVVLLILLPLVQIIVMLLTVPYNGELFAICWVLGNLAVSGFVIYFAVMLSKLQKGGKEIADGNIDHKIDTKYMVLELKAHGEDLNRIGAGINLAVDERMKSERMKTELITNVSHDIKTPLTSIINYSDLICREETDNENIRKYSEILHNQSERMKRLIDDLVEASKASSGNIDIMLAECDARVLISQASGEYCSRLADAGLELICIMPEKEIRIMADGRRIWRVFDNLMNNARKYALAGTRVYLGLEEVGGDAVFSFKNISREPFSVGADELTERFVRGDASRNTEGNGLGLSIAKSLTELQGGRFEITVDGDLFKVTVTIPTVK